ncbi:MAG: AmmeMemoRadiSam system protein B [Deltaproteobacteria bacterium]|jgi:MEMO1 family protein|nr:AmmeMemoRadiSam system protein B [Deltaproteobacteria bacterium]
MDVRRAAFAGSWYPENADECEAEIQRFIAAADPSENAFVGGIVPHAGWYFSGEIACRVIYGLSRLPHPDVMVLFGMHLHPGSPNHIMLDGAWETPFGDLVIETELPRRLAERFDFQVETVHRHTQDNTIELQLPFIKYFFPDTKIVPLGVPPAGTSVEIGRAVAEIALELGLGIKIIGSTDLTHYGLNYDFSPKGSGMQALRWVKKDNDRRAVDAMLSLDAEGVIREGLANQNACCAGAAAAAIAAAVRLGAARGVEVAYATSYDKHPGDSFVGYVGVLFG